MSDDLDDLDVVRRQLEHMPSVELSEVVRFRLDAGTLAALDKLEADLRGQGCRIGTRSSLVRLAIHRFLIQLEDE